MTELRWVLLALGVILIVALYLWGRGLPQRWLARLFSRRSRPAVVPDRIEPEVEEQAPAEQVADVPSRPADSIVTLRFIPSQSQIACDKVILALRSAGLRHGRFGIFHKHATELDDEPLFSVASLTEPGSFDLTRATETKIPGMSIFMVLPGEGDPVERFDQMVAMAKELARELNGELRDEKGSSWSIQRERYVREEIIEYRHLMNANSSN